MDKEYKGTERTILINGEEVRLLANMQNSLIYRNAFGRDIIRDFYDCTKKAQSGELPVDTLELERFTWTMARTYNKDLPPFEEWEESLVDFPFMDIMYTVLDLMAGNLTTKSNIEAEKKEARAER